MLVKSFCIATLSAAFMFTAAGAEEGKSEKSKPMPVWDRSNRVGGTILNAKSVILKTSKTLEAWQKVSGLDKNSIHADPMFVDYEKGDFRLKEGSPARGKGATLP